MITNLTDLDIKLAFPWVLRFRAILHEIHPQPFDGSHMLVGSDYSGSHRNSDYFVYAFLLADADKSSNWTHLRKTVRDHHLSDGRRMSFKRLNDGQRWRALVPFLEAADALSGVCAVVIVHKDLERMSTSPQNTDRRPSHSKPRQIR